MSVLEILTPSSPVDFGSYHSDNFVLILDGHFPSAPASPFGHGQEDVTEVDDWEDQPFPSLPPLHRGHPDVLLREGVMQASIRNEAFESDAERAFFVADLSQVYAQHQRWKACLPRIEPFYGTGLPIFLSDMTNRSSWL